MCWLSRVVLSALLWSTRALSRQLSHPRKRATALRQHVHIPGLEAAGLTAYFEMPVAFADISNRKGHTVPLAAVPGHSQSTRYTRMLMNEYQHESDASQALADTWSSQPSDRSRRRQDEQSQYNIEWSERQLVRQQEGASFIHNHDNVVYLASANVGGQDFELVLDTGSSDTWLVSDPFQCLTDKQMPTENAQCKFSKHYIRSPNFTQFPDLRFRISYADGERLLGIMGTETVTIGGIANPNTTIALVHKANWHGDNVSSGLLGMAFPSITHAMNGFKRQRYEPLFFDMYARGSIAPVFAVALNRAHEGPGALSLGGLPKSSEAMQYKETDFARAPMQKIGFTDRRSGREEYSMYVAGADGFMVGTQQLRLAARFVIDTGTTMSFVPTPIMRAIEAAWSPPLTKPCTPSGACFIPCDSVPPRFAIGFGGMQIWIDAEDMVVTYSSGARGQKTCLLGVGPDDNVGTKGLSMIGGTFMKSFVSVFDVGAAEMRFANRVRNGTIQQNHTGV